MGKLSPELIDAIAQIKPAMVATSSNTGQPNVSPKGSLSVLDEEYLIFADLRSPQTVNNLKENPKISIIGFDPVHRKGWRVWGTVDAILTSGELYEKVSRAYSEKGKVNHVVKVLVTKGIIF
jgi:uncharacterized protein